MPDKGHYDDLYRALLPGGAAPTPSKAHKQPVAVIAAVDHQSPASTGGVKPKDAILAANDVVLRDVIDWRWYADDAAVSLLVRDPLGHERTVVLGRAPGESWGIEFEHVVFDGVKTCQNKCPFCFVDQLPKGLRRPLYVRDDDYRLSFLQGNFITLTNLTDDDMERIDEQRLAPLYVSLHSVDPVVRKHIICARDDIALMRFDQLVELGIDLHVQIVLVPGENDASRLEQTLTWLAMRDGVRSVGVVPLGYTKHQSRFDRSYENCRDAAAVVEQIEPWRAAFRRRDGISWVHAADEFYLNARKPIPSASTYDGYPQYENGIGLVRAFVDGLAARAEELEERVGQWRSTSRGLDEEARRVTLLTGTLFAPMLESLVSDLGYDDVLRVLAVPNHLFGGNVSVTGLLAESGVSAAIRADHSPGAYLLPDVVANPEGLTLDDVPAADLGPLTGHDVRLVSSDAAGLVEGLRSAIEHPPTPRLKSR